MLSLTRIRVAGVAAAVVPSDSHVGELVPDQLVAPVAEGSLSELLDVALVHQGDRLAVVLDGVVDRRPDQPLGAGDRDRLYPDPAVGPDVPAELLVEHLDHPLGLHRALLDLETGVDVLGVLPENHHVDQVRALDRRGHSLEPADGPQADVQVEDLRAERR